MGKIASEIELDVGKLDRLVFGWVDYCFFIGLLGLSLIIGIYFGFFSKQNSTSEYLYGGKTMHYLPVAISILASFLSGITFLGIPTEVYQYGSQYFASLAAPMILGLASIFISMPVFHKLQISTCFEYLEMRFSKRIRTFSSVLYIISLFLFIPVIVYVPALAFSQVTGFSVHIITPVLCLICITYTSMGGVKAVVWTDTVQFIFTIGGLITVLTIGIMTVGGVAEIWRLADEGGRIKFFNLQTDFTKKETLWALSFGYSFAMYSRLGLGQKFIQRYLAIEKEKDLKRAVWLTSLGWGIIQIACIFTGLIMYARYHDCDPAAAKIIDKPDQILPYYIMDVAGHISGLPGIFLAGLASSALSTMSASLNTLSGLICDTFIKQWIPESPRKDAIVTNFMKAMSVIVGVITICEIFVIERLGTIFEMAVGLGSVAEGALLGLFLVGMLMPWIGKTGAMTGACASFLTMAWIVIGSQYYTMQGKIRSHPLPTSTAGCPSSFNVSSIVGQVITIKPFFNETLHNESEPLIVYRISVLYFTLIGSVVVIVVGGITSCLVGEWDSSRVNYDHVAPIIREFLPLKKMDYSEVPLRETEMMDLNDKVKYNTTA